MTKRWPVRIELTERLQAAKVDVENERKRLAYNLGEGTQKDEGATPLSETNKSGVRERETRTRNLTWQCLAKAISGHAFAEEAIRNRLLGRGDGTWKHSQEMPGPNEGPQPEAAAPAREIGGAQASLTTAGTSDLEVAIFRFSSRRAWFRIRGGLYSPGVLWLGTSFVISARWKQLTKATLQRTKLPTHGSRRRYRKPVLAVLCIKYCFDPDLYLTCVISRP